MTNKDKGVLAALIAAVGAIIVALITIYGSRSQQNPTEHKKTEYAGRVIDKESQKAIKGAQVSIDTTGKSENYYTDDNGIFHVFLDAETKGVRIRVEAKDYIIFDGNVAPTSRTGLEDVRLQREPKGVSVGLPDGLSLKAAIKFVAEMAKSGTNFVGNCNQKFMNTNVRGGEFNGKDWGDIIKQLQFRLVNAQGRAGYQVKPLEGVFQIDCTN